MKPDDEYVIIDGKMIIFDHVDAQVVLISPDDAAMLLRRNGSNRPLDATNLAKLMTDVKNGDFTYNGASVVLSCAGLTLDGQHRLTVIVKTGVSLLTVISTGVPVAAQRDMDSGKSRTLADNLAMDGEVNPSGLSAVLVGLQAWERGERSTQVSSRGTTIHTSYRFLEQHPEARELAKESGALANKINGFGGKQIAQFIWAFDKLNVDDRKYFFARLSDGVGLEEGNPILQLRNSLNSEHDRNEKRTSYHRAALLCKAWNQFRDNDRKKLSFRPGGAKPEAFPEPR